VFYPQSETIAATALTLGTLSGSMFKVLQLFIELSKGPLKETLVDLRRKERLGIYRTMPFQMTTDKSFWSTFEVKCSEMTTWSLSTKVFTFVCSQSSK
jgi:uncharacterized protein (DUF2344 family)